MRRGNFGTDKGPYLMFLSGGPPEIYEPLSIHGSVNESVFVLRAVGGPAGGPITYHSPSNR